MYAPPYFAQPQQLEPGYMQPYPPIFQTPEQGQKRISSPLLVFIGEKEEKRSRNEGLTVCSSDDSASVARQYSLLDVMEELKKLATKEDLVQVKGTLIAESAEIQQLKGELGKHNERIKSLEEQVGARAAVELDRTHRRPEGENVNRKQYGGAQAGADRQRNRRRSIVMHGLWAETDDALMDEILDVCQAMNAIIFSSDIVDIDRLGRSDPKPARPAPVRVTFEHNYMRDKILQKKAGLATKEKFANIFINADDPADIRRIKGYFRRVAYKARSLGKEVMFRSEWIQIDGVTYNASDLGKIPPQYNPDPVRLNSTIKKTMGAPKTPDEPNAEPEKMETATKELPVPVKDVKDLYYDPNVKLKITKSGLTFSGSQVFS